MVSEEVDMAIEITNEAMESALQHLHDELLKIRAGKASPAMLSGLMVEYYGSPTPITQVANIATSDARTITIQPWEKSMLGPIEQAIFKANLGLTPMNDGEIIRIGIPPLTEERRLLLVKQAKHLGEEGKISLRSARHKALDTIKKAVKDGYPEDAGKRKDDQIDKMTQDFGEKIDKMVEAKEKDILTV
jgi:ribosome recycling factor